MKLSVICKTKEWQVERLKEEATKLSVNIEVIDISSHQPIPENLGEVVLWRSSSLGGGTARGEVMRSILKKHILINRCLVSLPLATEKDFQQKYVKEKTASISCIPTFCFLSRSAVERALAKGEISFPFIVKPNKGSKGEGVALIHTLEELGKVKNPLSELVFQNFIKNSGDYRVFVLGGRVLGVIKRTAEKGGFLNNISQGGTAEMVTDRKTLSALRRIGTTVASVFGLTLCGVDVIYDETRKKFFFLEVNTVPQWKGFQEATGINVAKEIILLSSRLAHRKKQSTVELVQEEYATQTHLLDHKKFHFLSRMFLWTKLPVYKKRLDALRVEYIGMDGETNRATLQKVYAAVPEHGDRMVAKEERTKFFTKYPELEPRLNLLFKNLFVKKIYDIDLSSHIQNIVSDADLLDLRDKLVHDTEALQILSTHAINYLYLLEFYLGKERAGVNPKYYLEIGSGYSDNSLELQVYFFTHCIIGASRFYSEKIKPEQLPFYIVMLEKTEKIIREHFQEISLDNKFEFLVCARLCGFTSSIEKEILHEADQSFSPDANFLIDTKNAHAAPEERNDFIGSEHRNVLFIMSQTPHSS